MQFSYLLFVKDDVNSLTTSRVYIYYEYNPFFSFHLPLAVIELEAIPIFVNNTSIFALLKIIGP